MHKAVDQAKDAHVHSGFRHGKRLHSKRFRLRSSCWSSSGRSAVSAGFRSEWTLLAMLERRVAGREVSCRGYLDPGMDQPCSALSIDGDGSAGAGGVA